MIRPSKAVIAGAAVAGLLTGSVAVRAYAASTSGNPGVSLQTMADAEKGKHACKGQNDCKGQGDVRPVTMDAKARTPAKAREAARPTEVNRRKHSNESLAIYFSSSCASRVRGPEFSKSDPRIRSQTRGRSFSLRVLIGMGFKSMWM
jgi:hypothetical protein